MFANVRKSEFDRLAVEQIEMLNGLAKRLTGDHSAAEDLVQETYLRAFRASTRFRLAPFGMGPWLVRILHNLHCSRLLSTRRAPRLMDAGTLRSLECIPSRERDPYAAVANAEPIDERLERALNDLPGEYRSVVQLWALEEMSTSQISQALNIPLGTVLSRMHRARNRLVQRLKNLAKERGLLRLPAPSTRDAFIESAA